VQIKATSHTGGRLIAFVAMVALVTLGRQASAKSSDPTYTLFEVPGATGTQANSINNRGDIAGQYTLPGNLTAAFILSKHGEWETFSVSGSVVTIAYGINTRGDVVGSFTLPGAGQRPRGFTRIDDVIAFFDAPGSIETVIRSINDAGEMTGLYRTPDGNGHGFVYSNEQFSSFDVPGANFTTGVRINNRADIVGFWTASPTCGCGGPNPTTFKAFLFSDGEFTPFELPDSVETTALGINERGDIVGRNDDIDDDMTRRRHGYILKRHGAYETFDLPDAITTSAIDINARGDIVGFIRRASDGKTVSFFRR
jgi:uncharacterized membrane protein